MLQRRTLFWSTAIESDGGSYEKQQTLPNYQRGFESYSNFSNMALQSLNQWRVETPRAIDTMRFSEALLVEKYRSMTIDGRVRFSVDTPTQRIGQLKRFMATSNLADISVDHARVRVR